MLLFLTIIAGFGVALVNGANDNGKPVATLIGSGICTPRQGLGWGFWTTLAGSLCALIWGAALLKAFSGQGIVSAAVMKQGAFLPVTGLAAAGTVALATRLKLPVSTTHALLGALVGAGVYLGHGEIAWKTAAIKFAGPLLLSPVVAVAVSWGFVQLFRARILAPAAIEPSCVCLGSGELAVEADGSIAMGTSLTIKTGTLSECAVQSGFVILPTRAKVYRVLHVLSAGAVSFARGLNDTPKLAALLLPLALISKPLPVLIVAGVMGLGGWFLAKGVAGTMSHGVADLEGRESDAFAGNLATAFLVLLASRWGLPVSTTHVATGALVGTSQSRSEIKMNTLRNILLAWVITLPMAAAIAMLLAVFMQGMR